MERVTHKNGNPRTALQFLIDYCKEHGILDLVTGLAHPCRSGILVASNRLTKAEVHDFLKLGYKMMAHHCFFGDSTKVLKEKEENATASNPSQDVIAPLTPDQEATLLYDTIKLRCTECPVILACLLGLINMSMSVARIGIGRTGQNNTEEHRMSSRWVGLVKLIPKL
jgi:hypothetical protein